LVADVAMGESRSLSVAHKLLSGCGVVVTPGVVFGEDYDGFVRFAAVTTEERLREVVTMMGTQK
jgi:aspartate/methionine/tyrosine aminotransferase